MYSGTCIQFIKWRVCVCDFLTDECLHNNKKKSETVLNYCSLFSNTESDVTFSIWPRYAATLFVFTSAEEKGVNSVKRRAGSQMTQR